MPPSNPQSEVNDKTLLCERCGYIIEGLPVAGVCPECGLPIEQSLPSRRQGSPMQRRHGFGPLLLTSWLVLRHPLRTLDSMSVSKPPVRALLLMAALPIGQLLGVGVLLLLELERRTASGAASWSPGSVIGSMALGIILGCLLTPVAMLMLGALTWIEARGLVIFGAQAGSRMHPELAHTIVRHGAAGWLVSGLGAALMLPLAWGLETEFARYLGSGVGHTLPRWSLLLAALGIALVLAGFLAFECFAWLGLRRCRFANKHRSAPQQDE